MQINDVINAILFEIEREADSDDGMGRPPLGMKATTIRLSVDTIRRIEAQVGNRQLAKFIREASSASFGGEKKSKSSKPDRGAGRQGQREGQVAHPHPSAMFALMRVRCAASKCPRKPPISVGEATV